MPQGATSLLPPAPAKRMGFSIESLVGGRTSPTKSESPPSMHHQIATSRLFSDHGRELRCFPSENGFNTRDLLFQRDLMALREHHQQQQHQQQLANESILREQIILRQRMQEHLTHQQIKRDAMTREILNHDISRELLSREQTQFESREITADSLPHRRSKNSPRNSPRSSPRNSPPLPQTSSSPQSYSEEERTNSSPSSTVKKLQPLTPPPTSPGISSTFLNPLHGHMLPGLPPQFMNLGGTPGGPAQIHIPTPMVQHPLLGSGLPQGLGSNPLGGGSALGLGTPLPPVARDFPLYPWLLSRHGRVFQPGFPGKIQANCC